MNLGRRLNKLEMASGINEPCRSCDWAQKELQLLEDGLRAQGLTPHTPKQKDLHYERCDACGRLRCSDRTFISKADRRAWDEMEDEYKRCKAAGREVAPEWWGRLAEQLDRWRANARVYYGPGFDVALAQTDWHELYDLACEWARETTESKAA